MLRRTLGESVVIEAVAAGGLWRAHIDAAQLESTLVNLAINARDAMPEGGKLTIESSNVYLDRTYAVEHEDVEPGQYVMVAVTDTGAGIPPHIIGNVVEPFFTTKPPGKGTGLGLSQAHGFIKQSGGHLRIYSEVGVGTTVKLYLPRSTASAEPVRATPAKPRRAGRRNLTVLLAEDEAGVRDFAEQALSELGYDVLPAASGAEALTILDSRHDVAVLLTDVVMPEMNGRVLADAAVKCVPALKVVFMTGYTRNAIVHNGVLDHGARLVNKPFTVAELGDELDAALNTP
jgi:CheY-like chemotaxis protein